MRGDTGQAGYRGQPGRDAKRLAASKCGIKVLTLFLLSPLLNLCDGEPRRGWGRGARGGGGESFNQRLRACHTVTAGRPQAQLVLRLGHRQVCAWRALIFVTIKEICIILMFVIGDGAEWRPCGGYKIVYQ